MKYVNDKGAIVVVVVGNVNWNVKNYVFVVVDGVISVSVVDNEFCKVVFFNYVIDLKCGIVVFGVGIYFIIFGN